MTTASLPARERAVVKPTRAAAPAAKNSATVKSPNNADLAAKVAKPTKPAKAAKPAKPAQPAQPADEGAVKRERLVRDSFTMPKGEYAELVKLKQRATVLAAPARKSELLRAGVKALAAMDDPTLLAALQGVPALKTGRPSSKG